MTELSVLVLEDDHQLRGLLRRGLEEAGFRASGAATAAEALAAVDASPPDLIVVDVGLPDADGRDVVQALRAAGHDMPVLFLTARDSLADRLSGFSAGGDDYLTKPFAIAEVVARLRALGRRSATPPPEGPGGLVLDPGRRDASVGAARVQLTPTEFRILARLAADTGTTVRRQDLVGAAWPHGAVVHANTLDVYVARLRRKLTELPGELQIHTAHGIGYALR
jgi:two-component system response regulator MprA